MTRTKTFRGSTRQLLVRYGGAQRGHKLSSQSLSCWLVEVISLWPYSMVSLWLISVGLPIGHHPSRLPGMWLLGLSLMLADLCTERFQASDV